MPAVYGRFGRHHAGTFDCGQFPQDDQPFKLFRGLLNTAVVRAAGGIQDFVFKFETIQGTHTLLDAAWRPHIYQTIETPKCSVSYLMSRAAKKAQVQVNAAKTGN